jgi:hypothetical protein
VHTHLVLAVQSTSPPSWAISAIIVSTSRIRGTLCSTTGSLVSRQAARIGSAPFLFPVVLTWPLSGWPPWITKDSASESLMRVWAIGTAILAPLWRRPASAPGRP